MKIRFSTKVDRELKKIKKTNQKLCNQIQKQLDLFSKNPNHPSLRVHKLTGGLNNARSISINRSVRMAYRIIDKDTAYFIDVGTHDEVYKK